MIPRQPNKNERQSLIGYIANQASNNLGPEDYENCEGHVNSAAIAVFDDYITNSPGYDGKIMVVVWPADISVYEVFAFDFGGKMIHINQDASLVQDQSTEPF